MVEQTVNPTRAPCLATFWHERALTLWRLSLNPGPQGFMQPIQYLEFPGKLAWKQYYITLSSRSSYSRQPGAGC